MTDSFTIEGLEFSKLWHDDAMLRTLVPVEDEKAEVNCYYVAQYVWMARARMEYDRPWWKRLLLRKT